MDRIIRKHLKYPLRKGAKRIVYEQAYEIYTKDEAKERNIDYKHWRECKKGDYGISDDGFVAICLNRREYKNTSNLVFPYGQGFARKTGSAKLEYLPHKKSGSYVNLSAKKNYELKAQKTQYKNFAKTYAAMVMAGHVDYNVLGKVFDVNEPQPMAKAKSLSKSQRRKLDNLQIKKEAPVQAPKVPESQARKRARKKLEEIKRRKGLL